MAKGKRVPADPEISKCFADQMRKIVCPSGYSKTAFAEKAKISSGMVAQYLKGSLPRADILFRISAETRRPGSSIKYAMADQGRGEEKGQVGMMPEFTAKDLESMTPEQLAGLNERGGALAVLLSEERQRRARVHQHKLDVELITRQLKLSRYAMIINAVSAVAAALIGAIVGANLK